MSNKDFLHYPFRWGYCQDRMKDSVMDAISIYGYKRPKHHGLVYIWLIVIGLIAVSMLWL